jgi:hypothetical protein
MRAAAFPDHNHGRSCGGYDDALSNKQTPCQQTFISITPEAASRPPAWASLPVGSLE